MKQLSPFWGEGEAYSGVILASFENLSIFGSRKRFAAFFRNTFWVSLEVSRDYPRNHGNRQSGNPLEK